MAVRCYATTLRRVIVVFAALSLPWGRRRARCDTKGELEGKQKVTPCGGG